MIKLKLILLLWIGVSCCAAERNEITIIKQDGRRIELSVPSEGHPVPGPYRVEVVLPLGYDKTRESYRVLYVFDGSDLSEYLDALVQEDLAYPAIQVAIHNRTYPARVYDTTPPGDTPSQTSGGLEAFHDLLIHRIKPYLAAHFRTREGADSTGIIGHSLAGLAACWLGYVHPETYGLVGCMQPSLWWDNERLLKRLQQETSAKSETRFWIMAAEKQHPNMWRNAKRAADALARRGWREGDDLAFYQVHNGLHGWGSCKTQLRDMLAFLLRRQPWELIDIHVTNCHEAQYQPLRLQKLGEYANIYLDLDFARGLRTTAICPDLQIANAQVAQLSDIVTGQLIPVGPGWTTVTSHYQGHRASLAVLGFSFNSHPRYPIPQAATAPVIDGDLSDWALLPYAAADGDASSTGYSFGITYDVNFVYIGVDLLDDTWGTQDRLADPLNQDGLEILLDARPDPMRSLGRGKERCFDFLTLQMSPGKTAETMKIRRRKAGYPILPAGLQAVCIRTVAGYRAEIAIPGDILDKAQEQPWQELRLNICQVDVDDPNTTAHRVWWQADWESTEHVIGSGTFTRQGFLK